MARTYVVSSGGVAMSAVVAAHSLILVNPTNFFVVTEVGVSFNASASSAGVLFELYRTTTLGSPAGTVFTPIKSTLSADQAATATALINLTTEPTAVEILRQWYLQPFGGPYVFQFPLGREPAMSGTSTNRVGLRYTGVAAVTPNVAAYTEVEE